MKKGDLAELQAIFATAVARFEDQEERGESEPGHEDLDADEGLAAASSERVASATQSDADEDLEAPSKRQRP